MILDLADIHRVVARRRRSAQKTRPLWSRRLWPTPDPPNDDVLDRPDDLDHRHDPSHDRQLASVVAAMNIGHVESTPTHSVSDVAQYAQAPVGIGDAPGRKPRLDVSGAPNCAVWLSRILRVCPAATQIV
jgi:hypothetical protein